MSLSEDLRHAWRTVRRDLRFHGVLTALLALPVAALVAALSAAYGLLAAPPPYDRPDELVLVSNRFGHESRRSPASAVRDEPEPKHRRGFRSP